MGNRYRRLFAIGGISAVLLFSGCNGEKVSSVDDVVKETPVQVGEITKGSLTVENEIIAKIASDSVVNVIPKMVGELIQVNVKKGDQVKKGDVLAVINNSDQKLALEMEKTAAVSTEGQYEQALLAKEQAENAVKTAELAVKEAELNVEKAKSAQETGAVGSEFVMRQAGISVEDAEVNYRRMKDLYDAGTISEEQVSEARSVLEKAKAALAQAEGQSKGAGATAVQVAQQALEQAKIGLANAKQQVEIAEIGIKQAQAGMNSNNLRIKQAEERLSDFQIRAAISGEVTAVNGQVGEIVSTGAPFATLVDTNNIQVQAQLTAEQLLAFQAGQEIKVNIPSLDETFTAKIDYVAGVANETGFYALEASILEHDGKVKPGMIAKVIQETVVSEESLLVPTHAVIEQGDAAYIFVIQDGEAVQTPVQIRAAETEQTAIEGKGLTEDTVIVVKGQHTLADGDKVKIIEEEA